MSIFRRSGIVAILFCGLLVLVGLALMLVAYKNTVRQASTSRWVSTVGQVMERRLDPPRLVYSYQVGEVQHVSDRILYMGMFVEVNGRSEEGTHRLGLLSGLPATGPIAVYYDPASPSDSVLVKGSHPLAKGDWWFGAVFAGGGIVFMAFWLVVRAFARRFNLPPQP